MKFFKKFLISTLILGFIPCGTVTSRGMAHFLNTNFLDQAITASLIGFQHNLDWRNEPHQPIWKTFFGLLKANLGHPAPVLPSERIHQIKTYMDEVYDQEVASYLIQRMQHYIAKKGYVVVQLPFGKTPVGIYKIIIEKYHDRIDWDKVYFTNMDEYVIDEKYPDLMKINGSMKDLTEQLFEPLRYVTQINLKVHLYRFDTSLLNEPQTMIENAVRERQRFIESIKNGHSDYDGSLDITLGGIGPGPSWAQFPFYYLLSHVPGLLWLYDRWAEVHIAFDGAGSPVHETGMQTEHAITLTPATIKRNRAVVKQAITSGLARMVRDAKEVIILAKGESKQTAIWISLMGPITSYIPTTIYQRYCSKVTLLVNSVANPWSSEANNHTLPIFNRALKLVRLAA